MKLATTLFAKAKRLTAKLPLVRRVLAMRYAFGDARTPLYAKATIFFAIAYFVFPFDLIPDVFAGLGYADDTAVIMAALRMLGKAVDNEHYLRADATMAEWKGQ